jgi:hypothetical protein
LAQFAESIFLVAANTTEGWTRTPGQEQTRNRAKGLLRVSRNLNPMTEGPGVQVLLQTVRVGQSPPIRSGPVVRNPLRGSAGVRSWGQVVLAIPEKCSFIGRRFSFPSSTWHFFKVFLKIQCLFQ